MIFGSFHHPAAAGFFFGSPRGGGSDRAAGAARRLLLAVALLAAAAPASSEDATALRTASLAATCAACHGTAGVAVAGAVVPGLAAMPAADLRAQMLAYRNGTRPGTVMPQIAKGYSDAQIDRLAAYFAAQPSR